ncbi:NADH-quinone oxidoreductase subunit C [Streptomyces fradiae]|uniref:NADH-quinone oxidoreductase subunit C n=1 Tax=Streptomyces fradiae TaxID=1906 RepID=UPI003410535F
MNAYDSLPEAATDLFGAQATAERAYDLLTVDVPAASWIAALRTARSTLGCTYFDWLSAVDEPGTGFRVCAHVAALESGRVRRLLLRTTVPHDAAALPTAVGVYAGAAWHERETTEMFGVTFEGHPNPAKLLLPDNFEGHPLRKDFVLAARVAKAWPGAKEPGESEHGGTKRRQMLPPGVPDPNDWGPMKGQLPPAPARPARTARAGAAGGADRPPRRTRTASQGSAGQAPTPPTAGPTEAPPTAAPAEAAPTTTPTTAPPTEAPPAGGQGPATPGPATPRRGRSASEGSATQRRARSASEGSATQRRSRSASEGSASRREPGTTPARPRPRSADAPWNNPRPAFDTPPSDRPDAPAPDAPSGADEPKPPAVPRTPAAPQPSDATPDQTPDATPDQTPDATPDTTPEAPEADRRHPEGDDA